MKLIKLLLLMTVLVCCCGNSWCQNDSINSSTGGLSTDSVLVAYDDIRKANAKMIELKFEKEINAKYKAMLRNDSIIIDAQDKEIVGLYNKVNKLKRTRNISFGVVGGCLLSTILALVFGL